MSHAEKRIVDTYLGLFAKLSPMSRIQMIERLAKLLKVEDETTEKNFYDSFGAFASSKSAEDIVADIKSSRQFRRKEVKF